jgi:hypothetical protein
MKALSIAENPNPAKAKFLIQQVLEKQKKLGLFLVEKIDFK